MLMSLFHLSIQFTLPILHVYLFHLSTCITVHLSTPHETSVTASPPLCELFFIVWGILNLSHIFYRPMIFVGSFTNPSDLDKPERLIHEKIGNYKI